MKAAFLRAGLVSSTMVLYMTTIGTAKSAGCICRSRMPQSQSDFDHGCTGTGGIAIGKEGRCVYAPAFFVSCNPWSEGQPALSHPIGLSLVIGTIRVQM